MLLSFCIWTLSSSTFIFWSTLIHGILYTNTLFFRTNTLSCVPGLWRTLLHSVDNTFNSLKQSTSFMSSLLVCVYLNFQLAHQDKVQGWLGGGTYAIYPLCSFMKFFWKKIKTIINIPQAIYYWYHHFTCLSCELILENEVS